jgi:hypothetical protein
MEVRKTSLWDGDGLGSQACVAVDLALLAAQTLAMMSLDNPLHTNLGEQRYDNAKNITSQALGACLAKSQLEGASAAFLRNGFARRPSLRNPLGLPRWRQLIQRTVAGGHKKLAKTFFKPGRYNNCTLNSDINARWRCCLGDLEPGRWCH